MYLINALEKFQNTDIKIFLVTYVNCGKEEVTRLADCTHHKTDMAGQNTS